MCNTPDRTVAESGKQMDRRTAYTRMVIKESLTTLLEKKHLNEISVKELCELCDINRATFYRNFSDIYDVYEQMEVELTNDSFSSGDIREDRYQLLELIYKNQVFYREFFYSRLESKFIKETIANMYEEMKSYLISVNRYDEKVFRISYQYNYYGAIGVISEWLSEGCPESPKEFGDILYGIVEKQYQ